MLGTRRLEEAAAAADWSESECVTEHCLGRGRRVTEKGGKAEHAGGGLEARPGVSDGRPWGLQRPAPAAL